MSWSSYTREAEVGQGGDWPEIPDDLYNATIMDVSEPETGPDTFNPGQSRTTFYLTWELEMDDGTFPTLRQYVSLPPAFLEHGILGEKANLYRLMQSLGFDMTGRFRVDPPSWCGTEARVMVENRANKEGVMRPRITDVKPARSKRPAPKAAKQPVAAGSLRSRLATDDEDDEPL